MAVGAPGEVWVGMGAFFGYYAAMAALLPIIKVLFKVPGELFRKMLHISCAMSVFVLLYALETWYLAALVVLVFALVVYPVLALAQRYPIFMKTLEERRTGEIKSSLVILCLMMATLIAIFWGAFGPEWKYVIVVSIMAWGFGDAAAALVGKAWGRRRIRLSWVEGPKTMEGTLAMFVFAALAIAATLAVSTAFPLRVCLAIAILTAPVCALVELISRRGSDTITVPFAGAASVFILVNLLATG